MPKYLVTGAAGFIGSRVAAMLSETGNTVVAADSFCPSYDPRMKQWRAEQLRNHSSISFHETDIADFDALQALWKSHAPFDGVINLAAMTGVRSSVTDPFSHLRSNTNGVLNVLELCRHEGPAKLVQASTSSVYGGANPVPFSEDADTDHPISPYAASKKAAEALAFSYHHLYGLDVTIFRYFTVYGPAGRPDMAIFRFIKWISEGKPVKLFGDGSQARDFTYVDDIARGTIAGLKPLGYEAINLGSDSPITVSETIARIERFLGKSAQIEHLPVNKADVERTWANVEKAHRLLGWRPQVNQEQGIEKTIAWYRANESWASKIDT